MRVHIKDSNRDRLILRRTALDYTLECLKFGSIGIGTAGLIAFSEYQDVRAFFQGASGNWPIIAIACVPLLLTVFVIAQNIWHIRRGGTTIALDRMKAGIWQDERLIASLADVFEVRFRVLGGKNPERYQVVICHGSQGKAEYFIIRGASQKEMEIVAEEVSRFLALPLVPGR